LGHCPPAAIRANLGPLREERRVNLWTAEKAIASGIANGEPVKKIARDCKRADNAINRLNDAIAREIDEPVRHDAQGIVDERPGNVRQSMMFVLDTNKSLQNHLWVCEDGDIGDSADPHDSNSLAFYLHDSDKIGAALQAIDAYEASK
jgi:hypothetical protein